MLLKRMAPSVAKERFASILYDLLNSDWLQDVARQFCAHQEINMDKATLDTLIEILKNYVRRFYLCKIHTKVLTFSYMHKTLVFHV